jgi:hypothetical protein
VWNLEHVGASRGPEMRGSKPSMLPHLTMLQLCSTQFIATLEKIGLIIPTDLQQL